LTRSFSYSVLLTYLPIPTKNLLTHNSIEWGKDNIFDCV
jgi:hypothetical protein